MAATDATAPVLRFTLRILDSLEREALARTCVQEMVDLFGAVWARWEQGDEVLASHARSLEAASDEGLVEVATLSFRMAAGRGVEPESALVLGVAKTPDLPIVRQQFLDLVGVVRRAYAHACTLEEEVRKAREDPLTGLWNRRSVEEYLEHALRRSIEAARPLSVMLVDLDEFKGVNDQRGHAAGDEVLKEAAACFRGYLRAEDRACRWGGDEFLVVLEGVDAAGAVPIAERLRRAFATRERAHGTTMTIGLADTSSLREGRAEVAALIERADACLYGAKAAGRNRTGAALPPGPPPLGALPPRSLAVG